VQEQENAVFPAPALLGLTMFREFLIFPLDFHVKIH